MSYTILAGFVPLVDAAVLVAAKEKSFASEHGIDLELVKQPSWASLRDHLNLGHIDCAHALAPMPIASALGIGQVHADIGVPFVLGRGGNAITVGRSLADELRTVAGGAEPRSAADWGAALRKIVQHRDTPLTFAMVYPFSGHNFEIRYWLAASGIHPDRDVRLVAIPPPLMVESLRAGHVDGFCVGAPWNTLAVEEGIGEIIVSKSEIFPHGIEKVLAVPESLLADPERSAALLKSLDAAAKWCDEPANHAELVSLLAWPQYLNVDPEISLRAVQGLPKRSAPFGAAEPSAARDPDFLYFSRYDANRPRTEEALWIYAQMCRWGQLPASRAAEERAARVFRRDMYEEVFGPAPQSEPLSIPACDDVGFAGGSVASYLARFALYTPFASSGLAPE